MSRTSLLLALALALAACSDNEAVVGARLDATLDAPDTSDTPLTPDAPPDRATDAEASVDAPPGMDADVADVAFRCATDDECVTRGEGRVCDTDTGQCAQCLPGPRDRCPAGQYCDTATRACAAGCRDDMGCAVGNTDAGTTAPHCDTATRTCVACTADEHCAPGTLCVGHVCVMGCNATRPCPTGQTCCDGACIDTQASTLHCGGCGMRCAVPNATPACRNGNCAVSACTGAFADCDMVAANGCETDTATTVAHCGACGNACAARDHSDVACSAGRCVYTCQSGYADCNGSPTDGCETDLNADPSRCGTCTNACDLPRATAACRMGRCAVGMCAAGYGDCDGTASNGCETDVNITVSHCGMCGNACPARPNAFPGCLGGRCVISCVAGYLDCDGVESNGCETDIRRDDRNCGACGRACDLPNATGACMTSTCAVTRCDDGFADCDMRPTNGCEVNLRSDVANCGACGMTCSVTGGAPACVRGACQVATCTAGLGDCDMMAANGCETDVTRDPRNCGACGTLCDLPNATPVCTAGRCAVMACATGFGDCDGVAANGCETNLNTTVTSCGACGRACALPNATAGCAMGACTVAACNAGFFDCDGSPSNGCEVDGRTDARNCNACGAVCALANATAACRAGACAVATCNTGFGDCNGVASDGCEANLSNSASHCGACGRACATGARCVSGSCVPVCNTGAPRVLIYGPAAGGDATYLPTGAAVTVASEAMWRAYTADDFARYTLLVIGDLNCSGPPRATLQALYDTRAVWQPVVTGRVLVHGQDPTCHAPTYAGARTYLTTLLRWLSEGPGTALYASGDWNAQRSLDYLTGFGAWSVTYSNAENVVITAPTHPVYAGSTNASLSGWGNSYHSYFTAFPTGFTSIATVSGAPAQHMTVVREPACVAP